MDKKIFISHSSKDKDLADSLVDLLQTGANISSELIFCTSLEGLGVKTGSDFLKVIKANLKSPEIVISLLTPNYFTSEFCLCELGATWINSRDQIPLKIPALSFDKIKGVLDVTQVSKIENKSDLTEIAQILSDKFQVKLNVRRWEKKRDDFLVKLDDILENLPAVDHVTLEEHSRALKELKKQKKIERELRSDLDKKLELIKKLKKLKDSNQVAEAVLENLDENEAFDSIVDELNKSLKKLPPIVSTVLYKEFALGEIGIRFRDHDDRNMAHDAYEDGYLEMDDEIYSLNENDPKVKSVNRQLYILREYIDSELTSEFFEEFETENEYGPDIQNKRFWNDYLSPWTID